MVLEGRYDLCALGLKRRQRLGPTEGKIVGILIQIERLGRGQNHAHFIGIIAAFIARLAWFCFGRRGFCLWLLSRF